MNTLKVLDIVQGRESQREFEGHYRFEDIPTKGDIACQWHVHPKTAGLGVEGHLQGTLELECGRCMQPYAQPVVLDIRERYVFSHYVERNARGEKELLDEDFYETVDETGELDLADLVHQLLILEATPHPLCGRPECAEVIGTVRASTGADAD